MHAIALRFGQTTVMDSDEIAASVEGEAKRTGAEMHDTNTYVPNMSGKNVALLKDVFAFPNV